MTLKQRNKKKTTTQGILTGKHEVNIISIFKVKIDQLI